MKNIKLVFLFLLFPSVLLFAQNKSIQFNGSTNYVTVNNSGYGSALDFTSDSITLEAWINPSFFATSSNSFEHTILGKDSLTTNGSGYYLSTGGSKKLNFSYNYGNGWMNLTSTNPVLNLNVWQHIAVTKENGSIKLYLNGQVVASNSFTTNTAIAHSTKKLNIGENGSINGRKFYGKIDEVKIWKKARSISDIQLDMTELCMPFTTDLVAYYKMNDTSTVLPINIKCENNNAYNGTLNGSLNSVQGAFLYYGGPNLYVDSSNTNNSCGSQNGSSWANAFSDLNDAISLAQINPNIEKIFIAKGTYHPTHFPYAMNSSRIGIELTSPLNIEKCFHIRTGLEVYGAYPSGGGIQNFNLYKTILDGSQVGGILNDTAYNVVFVDSSDYWATSFDTTKLIGLTIRNGHADLPSVSGALNISGAFGGGMYLNKGTYQIQNCEFYNNYSLNPGSSISTNYGNYIFSNNNIHSNLGNNTAFYTTYGNYLIENNIVNNNPNRGIENYRGNYIIKNNEIKFNKVGIYQNECASKILNNNVHQNESGVIIYYSDSAIINNNTINDNNSNINYGGGLYLYGGIQKVNGNTFNRDSSDNGGALYMFNGNNQIINNDFTDNFTSGTGGAILCSGGQNRIDGNIFKHNIAHQSGGMYVNGGFDTIANNYFVENIASYYNAGLTANASYSQIVNNVFTKNTASDASALECNGNSTYTSIISNNTFYKNFTSDSNVNGWNSAGLWIDYGLFDISNNIFYDNELLNSVQGADYFNYSGNVTFRNNLMQFPSTAYTNLGVGNYDLGINSSNNLFALNPLFLDTSNLAGVDNILKTPDDGLQLLNSSPAINVGNNTMIPSNFVTDITSNDRINNSIIDLGAYELNCLPVNITSNSQTTICQGSSVNLSVNTSSLPSMIQWFADSMSSLVLNTGYNFTTPILNSTDTFWVKSNFCANSNRIPIIVTVNNTSATILNTTPTSATLICANNSTTLTVSSNVIADSVFWYSDSLSNNPIDTGFSFTTPILNTTDTFWVNAHACTNSIKYPIIITVLPNTFSSSTITSCNSFTWSINNTTYTNSGVYIHNSTNANNCLQSDTLHLTIQQTNNTILNQTSCNNYYWALVSQTFSTSGIYYDTLQNVNFCDSIIQLNLTVNSTNATINTNATQLTAMPSNANYQWIKCNPFQLISGATNQNYTVISNGDYAVIATLNGCTDTSICVTINSVGIYDISNQNEITLLPNPSFGKVEIKSEKNISEMNLKVFNSVGKLIIEKHFSNFKNENIDLSNFSKGIYFIELKNSGVNYFNKILIQ